MIAPCKIFLGGYVKRVVIIIIVLLLVSLQHLSSQWTSDSSLNTRISNYGITPIITTDGDNGAIVFFSETGRNKAYIQRIDKNGYVVWNNEIPIQVGGYLKYQDPQAICSDGEGGAYLQYLETDKDYSNPYDTGRVLLFTNRIDNKGKLLWNGTIGINLNHIMYSNTKPVHTNDYDKIFYKMVLSSNKGYYYSWIDSVKPQSINNTTLKLQRILPDGKKYFSDEGLSITKDVPYEQVGDIIGDNKGGIYVTTQFTIYHYDSTGNNLLGSGGISISRFIRSIKMFYGNNSILCASRKYIETNNSSFYLTAIDSIGNVLWDKLVLDSLVFENYEEPNVLILQNNNISLFWKRIYPDSIYHINYTRVNKKGELIFEKPKTVLFETRPMGNVVPFSSDSLSIILIWSYVKTNFLLFNSIKIDSQGNNLWAHPISINSLETTDSEVRGINQNDKTVVLIWYEVISRGGIYAQNINSKGKLGPLTFVRRDTRDDTSVNHFSFIGNYPNPFNPNTEIIFELPRKGVVAIGIYDIAGREITKHEQYFADGGRYSFLFNASTFSSGMYLCSITFEGQRITKKMQFVK